LKTLKIDVKSFGKAWRLQAENLEMFGKSLEKAWNKQAPLVYFLLTTTPPAVNAAAGAI